MGLCATAAVPAESFTRSETYKARPAACRLFWSHLRLSIVGCLPASREMVDSRGRLLVETTPLC